MRTLLVAVATATLTTSMLASANPADSQATSARSGHTETVRLHSVDMRGKPPFRRSTETLPVTDAAAMEVATETDQPTELSGRPPYRRQR